MGVKSYLNRILRKDEKPIEETIEESNQSPLEEVFKLVEEVRFIDCNARDAYAKSKNRFLAKATVGGLILNKLETAKNLANGYPDILSKIETLEDAYIQRSVYCVIRPFKSNKFTKIIEKTHKELEELKDAYLKRT